MSKKSTLTTTLAVLGAGIFGWNALGTKSNTAMAAPPADVTEGSLVRLDKDGRPISSCPLKHTDVNAEISGFLARVTVTQEFQNNSQDPIEAIYRFPLPGDAAVDDMEMLIGKRAVKGVIRKKEEARKIYEDARNSGRAAALLDQERPNIFTQSVANIMPGDSVKITIRYVETMKYEEGTYEFSFPMVVGPRYTPQSQTDSGQVTVNRTPEGTRAGHDINVKVSLDAGMALNQVSSPSHGVDIVKADASRALVSLQNAREIPNKDFILRYDVGGEKIKDAVLAHHNDKTGGFFTLILQPPDRPAASEITPKEIVFVVDTSGSMQGYPMEKVKEVIKLAFDGLHPRDTFNLITFSGDEHILFPRPVPATRENIQIAWEFMRSRRGSGGTEMMKAIRASLDPSDSQDHLRVVCFMTDGEVGNDMEIISEIQKHKNARVFAFGIGNSVNRFLLDGMGRHGRGETQYVTLKENGSVAAKRFHERVRTPLLTDIEIDWNGLPVQALSPAAIPDLFGAKPLILSGRYNGSASGTITLRGKVAGRPYSRQISVNLPAKQPKHDVLATLWARRKVEELMARDYRGIQYGTANSELKQEITQLGLDFRLMTQFTSFVAVEDRIVNEGGRSVRQEVPVEMPEGVSYAGIYGDAERDLAKRRVYAPSPVGFAGGLRGQASMPMAESSVIVESKGPRLSRHDVPYNRQPATDKPEARPVPPPPIKMDGTPVSKLHPDLQVLAAGTAVKVQVWLAANATPQVLKALAAAGLKFQANTQSGALVVGTVSADKLAAIEAMTAVRFIAPVRE